MRPPSFQSGSAAVEAALLFPILLLLVAGLVDLSLGALASMQVKSAADAGARYASKNEWNVAQISLAVTSATGGSEISASPAPSQFCACPTGGTLTPNSCSSSCPNGTQPGLYGRVDAQVVYVPFMRFVGLPPSITLTGQSIVRLQ
jgi:Flp pilus assembly protein TadG